MVLVKDLIASQDQLKGRDQIKHLLLSKIKGGARINKQGWTREDFEAVQKQGKYKGMTFEQFLQKQGYENAKRDAANEQAAQNRADYDEMVKQDPDSEIIFCKLDSNGEMINKGKGEHTTRAECKRRNEVRSERAFNEWEAREHPINHKFFRPLVDGLTKIGDFAANNIGDKIGIPKPITDIYRTVGPKGSGKYYV